MEFVPFTHGIGVTIMLRVVVLVEEIILMSHLIFRTSLIGNSLRVAQLGLLDGGGDERLVLKFSFFCLLVFNGFLCLRQGAQ
jgi:hypothetical protein